MCLVSLVHTKKLEKPEKDRQSRMTGEQPLETDMQVVNRIY